MRHRSGPADAGHRPVFIRAVILTIASIAGVFGLFEIVERLWPDMEMSTIHLLHAVRGAVSTMLAAVLVCRLFVRSSPSLLASASAEVSGGPRRAVNAAERIAHHTHWFIRMRWVAVLTASTLIYATVRQLEWLPAEVLVPLGTAVAVLAILNLVYLALWRRGIGGDWLLVLQAHVDLVLLVVMLHLSGGIENPLAFLPVLHVIIAGILLSRWHCFLVTASASALLALMAWGEAAGWLQHTTLVVFPHKLDEHGAILHIARDKLFVANLIAVTTGRLFLIAWFVSTLAERLRQDERQIEMMATRAVSERSLLELALETTGTALRVRDGGGDVTWVNARWTRWFGDPSVKIEPEVGSEDPREGGPAAITTWETRLDKPGSSPDGSPAPGSGSGSGSGCGDPRTIRVRRGPLLDPEGQAKGIVELAHDVSPEKALQVRMVNASRMAAIGELAGHVAHEVNNPITIINGKARLLLSDHRSEMSAHVAEDIQKIIDLAGRVSRIALRLLSSCRPSGAPRQPLEIRARVRRVLGLIERRAATMGVRLVDDLGGNPPATVLGNSGELEQVFLNLVLNALDAMPRGGDLRVSVAGDRPTVGSPAMIAVVVADTGGGIPESIRSRIFEPFFTTKEEGKGTGLGLSVCLGIIRDHGGEIRVESETGKGSRFLVRLPLAQPGVPAGGSR